MTSDEGNILGPSPGPSSSPSQSMSPGPSPGPGPSQNGAIMDCSVLDDVNEEMYILDDSGSPICFNTQYAEEILNTGGLVRKTDTNILSKVTVEDLWNTVTNQYNQTPTGKRISYISDGSIPYEDMVNSGCIRYELEDCEASKEPSNCTYYEKTIKDCYADKCGEKLKKQVQYVKERPEFGEGKCDVDFSVRTVECDESEPPCCSEDDISHWTQPDDRTCLPNGTYNLSINSEVCSTIGMTNIPIKSEDCCYVNLTESEGQCIIDDENKLGYKRYTNKTFINEHLCSDEDKNYEEVRDETCDYLEGVTKFSVLLYGDNANGNIRVYSTDSDSPVTKDLDVMKGDIRYTHEYDSPVTIKSIRLYARDKQYGGTAKLKIDFYKDNEESAFKTFVTEQLNNSAQVIEITKPAYHELL